MVYGNSVGEIGSLGSGEPTAAHLGRAGMMKVATKGSSLPDLYFAVAVNALAVMRSGPCSYRGIDALDSEPT